MTRTLALAVEELALAGFRTTNMLSANAPRPYAIVTMEELRRVAETLPLALEQQPQAGRFIFWRAALPSVDVLAAEDAPVSS